MTLSTKCGYLADRGSELLRRMTLELRQNHSSRTLPDFYIERAAQLLNITSADIRSAEADGKLPSPRVEHSGTVQRRVYNLNEVNRIRAVLRPIKRRKERAVRLVFANLKGGVAKSTHALHFAHFAAREGYRVLVIDTDPQATLSGGFGIIADLDVNADQSLFPVLTRHPAMIDQVIVETHWQNIDLIPASLELQLADWTIPAESEETASGLGLAATRLARALDRLDEGYDYVVIDSPPSLGVLSVNALLAGDLIIMPAEPHLYTLASGITFFRIVSDVLRRYDSGDQGRDLRILFTRVDPSPETATVMRFINRGFAGVPLTEYMPVTTELRRAGTDQVSLYEIASPRGSRETFHRAVAAMDRVNTEILQITLPLATGPTHARRE